MTYWPISEHGIKVSVSTKDLYSVCAVLGTKGKLKCSQLNIMTLHLKGKATLLFNDFHEPSIQNVCWVLHLFHTYTHHQNQHEGLNLSVHFSCSSPCKFETDGMDDTARMCCWLMSLPTCTHVFVCRTPVKVETVVKAICQVGVWVSLFQPLASSKCYKCKYECMFPYNVNRQSAPWFQIFQSDRERRHTVILSVHSQHSSALTSHLFAVAQIHICQHTHRLPGLRHTHTHTHWHLHMNSWIPHKASPSCQQWMKRVCVCLTIKLDNPVLRTKSRRY